jgi:predicted nucleic acid-binding protein
VRKAAVAKAADSSVAIAAMLADEETHHLAETALKQCTSAIAHVAAETYSVLTRLPPPLRLASADAAAIVAARLPPAYATLDASAYAKAPARLAAAGVSGGATYDGLIALTALEHDLELFTGDRRAERTYRALEVPYTLLA